MKKERVTLRLVLEHVQALGQEMRVKFIEVDKRFTKVDQQFEALDKKLSGKIDDVERRLTRQIDAIDQRLDAVEIENLPKRVRKIERRMGLVTSK